MYGKNGVVKVRNFPGATVEDMQHNYVPILERNPSRLILHVGTINAESCTSGEILDKLLTLKTFISEKCPQLLVFVVVVVVVIVVFLILLLLLLLLLLF